MKTEWDYTLLADAYLKRPDYSGAAVDAMLKIAGMQKGDSCCDVGAGVAHLTLMLAAKGIEVVAVEPNDAMRANGIKRTKHLKNVKWVEGKGENLGLPSKSFKIVTFGSSFNVCNTSQALKEAARVLVKNGWIVCMWNHRQLDDPIQADIEEIIKINVLNYGYGTRRENQTPIIDASQLFGVVTHLDSKVVHEQTIDECVEAWRSHATLARQAGSKFKSVIQDIEKYLIGLQIERIQIPYTTNIWMAQLR